MRLLFSAVLICLAITACTQPTMTKTDVLTTSDTLSDTLSEKSLLSSEQMPQLGLPKKTLYINNKAVSVQIADTPETRNKGLMYRQSMPVHEGMLFVFTNAQAVCFWMKNTPLPLSIAFLDKSGKIVTLADMQPMSETEHCPNQPITYALEMNQGWFVTHHVNVGDKVHMTNE